MMCTVVSQRRRTFSPIVAPGQAAALALVAVVAVRSAHGTTLHVDFDAPAGGDGSAWIAALRYLQDALDLAAADSSVDRIHVAQGVYRPDASALAPDGTGDRQASFELLDGVSLVGGFAGLGAADPGARDPAAHATIVSGDLLGNDAADPWASDFAGYAENSHHVVTGSGTTSAVLDGFIVERGNAHGAYPDSSGGGLFNDTGSPMVIACTFRWNTAVFGAALHNRVVSLPVVIDCVFIENTVLDFGGAMYNGSSSDAAVAGCSFIRNAATLHTLGSGGAIFNWGSHPTVSDCTFSENVAAIAGGAAADANGSEAVFIDCLFDSNESEGSGGAVASEDAFPMIVNGRFVGNAARRGGAISATDSAPVLINCVLAGNSANDSRAGDGGAIHAETLFGAHAPELVNCTVVSNSAARAGGGIAGPASIANSIIWENVAGEGASVHQISGAAVVAWSCVMGGWAGEGNLSGDPGFADLLGADRAPGTGDEDVRLRFGSPCIDAGSNGMVKADDLDLDGDGNLLEATPVDHHGSERFLDDTTAADSGEGASPVVDLGACEHDPCRSADATDDGAVGSNDVSAVFASWGPCAGCGADVNGDAAVGFMDLTLVLIHWNCA